VIAGRTSAGDVHSTTTPRALRCEVTFVGAEGSEYVFAWAVGTSTEANTDVMRAIVPIVKFLRDVIFMAQLKQVSLSADVAIYGGLMKGGLISGEASQLE
jgi:hypothetical protein